MQKIEIINDESAKIIKGLEKVYEKLLEYKKAKNSVLVVLRNNKIVKIKPENLP
jgi:cell division protein FtsI/penicillin-binding protein 2